MGRRRLTETGIAAVQPAHDAVAAERIRKGGLRVTSARMLVLRALRGSDRPLAAAQVFAEVRRAGGQIDMVSVYRALAILASLGLVHHVGSVDGYTACRIEGDHGQGTAHIVCNECGAASERSLAPRALEMICADAEGAGFRAESVRVEVLGVCDSCRPG